MKKFLKMMLVLGLLALAVSGCIFDDDDDDDREIYGTWTMTEGSETCSLTFSESTFSTVKTDTIEEPYLFEVTGPLTYNDTATPKTFTYTITKKRKKTNKTSEWEDVALSEEESSPTTIKYTISENKLTTTYKEEDPDTYTRQ